MSRVLAACAVLLVAAACGNDGSDESASTTIEVPEGIVGVESVGGPVELPKKVRDQVLEGVRTYVENGVVSTLRNGKPGQLGPAFDEAALAGLGTDAGRSMLDRGAPAATGDVRAQAQPVVLVGLADAAGTVVLVAAHLDLEVVAGTDDGDLTVHRVGDLTFAPVENTWKITTYDVAVTRSGAGVETETTGAATG